MLQAPGWPAHSGAVVSQQSAAPVPEAPKKPEKSRTQSAATGGEADGGAGGAMRACVQAAAEAVAAAAGELDDMDSRVGDGDCGATLSLAAAAILQVSTLASIRACARARTHARLHRAAACFCRNSGIWTQLSVAVAHCPSGSSKSLPYICVYMLSRQGCSAAFVVFGHILCPRTHFTWSSCAAEACTRVTTAHRT